MTRTATRIARLAMVGSVTLLTAMPALAATASNPIQGWSAMKDTDTATLLRDVQTMPVSAEATEDQPYCAADAEIAATLEHDFNEQPVDTANADGTNLWGSAQMGTWTLVAERKDDTSCIIASGIGFDGKTDARTYYKVAGL